MTLQAGQANAFPQTPSLAPGQSWSGQRERPASLAQRTERRNTNLALYRHLHRAQSFFGSSTETFERKTWGCSRQGLDGVTTVDEALPSKLQP